MGRRTAKTRILDINLCLVLIECAGTVFWLSRIPADPSKSLFFGFSAQRLVLMSLPVIICISAIVFLILIHIKSSGLAKYFYSAISNKNTIRISSAAILIFYISLIFLRLYRNGQYIQYYERLVPFLVFCIVFGLQVFISALLLNKTSFNDYLSKVLRESRSTVWVSGGLLLLWIVIVVSKFGLKPDPMMGWGKPGVPLLEGQIISIFLFALIIWNIYRSLMGSDKWSPRFKKMAEWEFLDLSISVIILLGTFFLWISQPFPGSYFAPLGKAPNFEPYPNSDAAYVGLNAHSLLIGNGFATQIPTRPLYIVFISILLQVTKLNYEKNDHNPILYTGIYPRAALSDR